MISTYAERKRGLLSIKWKSDLSDQIKRDFSKLCLCPHSCKDGLHGRKKKKKTHGKTARWELHKNATHCFLKKSWNQHPTKQQLYDHLTPVWKTIQVRQRRHVEHSWRSQEKLTSDVLLWTPKHGCACVGWPVRTYLHQHCSDTGWSLEDLPGVMDDRHGQIDRERERERENQRNLYSQREWAGQCYSPYYKTKRVQVGNSALSARAVTLQRSKIIAQRVS